MITISKKTALELMDEQIQQVQKIINNPELHDKDLLNSAKSSLKKTNEIAEEKLTD